MSGTELRGTRETHGRLCTREGGGRAFSAGACGAGGRVGVCAVWLCTFPAAWASIFPGYRRAPPAPLLSRARAVPGAPQAAVGAGRAVSGAAGAGRAVCGRSGGAGLPGAGADPGPGARCGGARALPAPCWRAAARQGLRGQPGRAAGPGRAGPAGPAAVRRRRRFPPSDGPDRPPVQRCGAAGPGSAAPRLRGVGEPLAAACHRLTVSCFSPPTVGLCNSLPCGGPAFPARQRPTPVARKKPLAGAGAPGCRHGGQLPGFGTGTEIGGRPSGGPAAGCPQSSLCFPQQGAPQTGSASPQLRPSSRRRYPPSGASTAPELSPGRRRAGQWQDPAAKAR